MSDLQFRDAAVQLGYTSIPNVVLMSPAFTMQAKILYCQLLHYAWQGDAYPGRERLAAENNVSPNTIDKYIKELKDFGLITVVRRGLHQTNLYIIESITDEMVARMSLGTNFVTTDSQQTVNQEPSKFGGTDSQQTVNQESQRTRNHDSQQTVRNCSQQTVNQESQQAVNKENKKDFKRHDDNDDEFARVAQEFRNLFGFDMNETIKQEAVWYYERGVSGEMLIAAFKVALRNNIRRWTYAESVIREAYDHGARTLDQFEQYQQARKERMAAGREHAASAQKYQGGGMKYGADRKGAPRGVDGNQESSGYFSQFGGLFGTE